MLSVSSGSSLVEVKEFLFESTRGAVEMEGPQEVSCLFEVRSNREDLVDKIFHTDDSVLSENALDDFVIGKRNSLLVDLSVTSFVHELSDCFKIGVSVGNVRLDKTKHVNGSLVQLDEDSRVDLSKSKKLKNLAYLGGNTVDTSDTDHNSKLSLGLKEEVSVLLRDTSHANKILLHFTVLSHVLLRRLEHLRLLLTKRFLVRNLCCSTLSSKLSLLLFLRIVSGTLIVFNYLMKSITQTKND